MLRMWAAVVAVCACASAKKSSPSTAVEAPPTTRREAVTDTLHGVAVADPYRWLERGDDAEVIAWMDAQDRYASAYLARLPELPGARALIESVLRVDESTAPTHRNGRYFFKRWLPDRGKAVVQWRQGETGEPKMLFDPNTWPSADALGSWWPSPDGRLVVYVVREHNADEQVLRVRDVDAGTDLPDVISGLKWTTPSWAPDGKGFYYRWLPPKGSVDETERRGKAELRYHALGTDPAKDAVMFPATGKVDAHLDGFVSDDGHWLFATADIGWTETAIHVRDLRDGKSAWRPLVTGVEATYALVAWRDQFYVRTNDGASRSRVFRVDPAKLDRGAWTEIVAERPDATLQSHHVIGGKLVLVYLRNASSEVAIHELDGTFVRTVDLPPFGSVTAVTGNPSEPTGYLQYSSYTTPGVVWKLAVATGATTELTRVAVPVDTGAYVTEQVWFPSKDGTKVSMFLVRKRDVKPTGAVPTLLFGYGGFGESITPEFPFWRVSWLEAGGVYALANLRGGGEYGEPWHRAGMAENKQTTIDDLLAAGHYLIGAGWTTSKHLGIIGGSNGGLVVSAAMVQEPSLAAAVVLISPLTDMVRYPKFGHATAWIPEYGSPDDPAQFAALYAYSPYHHVVDKTAYPAVLIQISDQDDRVDPLHGRKLAAALQAATTGGPVLLQVLEGAGHSGADAIDAQAEKAAAAHAFAIAHLR